MPFKFFCTNPFLKLLKHKLKFLINSSVQIPLIKSEFLRNFSAIFRSSHRRCSIQKVFLKISWYSQENICGEVSFLIKLQIFKPVTLLKIDSNTGAFLWVSRIFKKRLCWRTTPYGRFWIFENCFLRTYSAQTILILIIQTNYIQVLA